MNNMQRLYTIIGLSLLTIGVCFLVFFVHVHKNGEVQKNKYLHDKNNIDSKNDSNNHQDLNNEKNSFAKRDDSNIQSRSKTIYAHDSKGNDIGLIGQDIRPDGNYKYAHPATTIKNIIGDKAY